MGCWSNKDCELAPLLLLLLLLGSLSLPFEPMRRCGEDTADEVNAIRFVATPPTDDDLPPNSERTKPTEPGGNTKCGRICCAEEFPIEGVWCNSPLVEGVLLSPLPNASDDVGKCDGDVNG